jgi:hypothetical protein
MELIEADAKLKEEFEKIEETFEKDEILKI